MLAPWAEPGDVLVWFPTRGLPTEAGRAVQPILAREIETVTDLTECPRAWLTDAYHQARHSRTLTSGGAPIMEQIETVGDLVAALEDYDPDTRSGWPPSPAGRSNTPSAGSP